jgi:hypothetical protein
MPYQSPGPPPFNRLLELHWPYSPFDVYTPGNPDTVSGEVDAWVVPTSRLNVLGHLGASNRFESEFKMPIVNYYIECPQYSEYLMFPCTFPYIAQEATTLEVRSSWSIDLSAGPTVMEDPDNPYETQYLVLWWERRWWGQDEYWVRAYCMGASWDALNPITGRGRRAPAIAEKAMAQRRFGKGVRPPRRGPYQVRKPG